jgi:hypothetical protein
MTRWTIRVMAADGPGWAKTRSDLVVIANTVWITNFCVYSFSTRPDASKIVGRFYRAEFSHSLGPGAGDFGSGAGRQLSRSVRIIGEEDDRTS